MPGPKRGWKMPTSYTAGKQISIEGTAYQPGDVVPNAVVKKIRNLSSLVSSRALVPNIDPHGRKTKIRTPSPIDYPARVRKAMPD